VIYSFWQSLACIVLSFVYPAFWLGLFVDSCWAHRRRVSSFSLQDTFARECNGIAFTDEEKK
jgi:hypothetical protein